MTDNKSLSALLQAKVQPYANELTALGVKIGHLYTDMGLPPDMALDRMKGYTTEQKIAIIDGICQWLIEHKRNSGATDKAIERQRKANREMVNSFVTTGELGIY